MYSSIVSLLALAASVHSQILVPGPANVNPEIPENSQIGMLNFPIQCTLGGSLAFNFTGLFSGSIPGYVKPGETTYLNDVISIVTIPASFTALAASFNAVASNSNITVTIDVLEATPSSFLLYGEEPYQLKNVPITPGQDVTITIPSSGVISHGGPVTASNNVGAAVEYTLGGIKFTIELLNAAGASIGTVLNVECPKQPVSLILGAMDIRDFEGPDETDISIGRRYDFAENQIGEVSGSFRIPYTCTFTEKVSKKPVGTFDLDVTITGIIPALANPLKTWKVYKGFGALRVTKALQAVIIKQYDAFSLRSTLKTFEMTSKYSSPPKINAVPAGGLTLSNVLDFVGTEDVVIPFPETGTLTIGDWTAPNTVNITDTVGIGAAAASVTLYDACDEPIIELDVVCPDAKLSLAGIPITNVVF